MKQFYQVDQGGITGWENQNNYQYSKIYANRLHAIVSEIVNKRKETSSSNLPFRENIRNTLRSNVYTKFNDIIGLKNDKEYLKHIQCRDQVRTKSGILNQLKYHFSSQLSKELKNKDEIYLSKEVDWRIIKASSQVNKKNHIFQDLKHAQIKKRNFLIKSRAETKKIVNDHTKQNLHKDIKQQLKIYQSQKINSLLNKRQAVKFPLFYREIECKLKKINELSKKKTKNQPIINILQKNNVKFGVEFVDDKIFSTIIRSERQMLFC